MAYFFVLLGITTALFIRVRQRAVKVAAVIAVGIVGGAAAASSIWGQFGLLRIIAVAVCLFLFLTIPLFLRALLVRDQQPSLQLPS